MDHKDEDLFTLAVLVLWMLSGHTFFFFVSLRSLSPGLPRLLSLLPFLPAFFFLPASVSSTGLRSVVAFIICWTCPSKLLLLCFNRFLDHPSWLLSRFSHFLAASLVPFRVIAPPKSPRSVLSRFFGLWYVVALICLFNLLAFEALFPQTVFYALHVALVFVGIQMLHWTFGSFMYACFKVELGPAFNNPLFATSLTDFWGKRWNLTVIAINRATVYEPVLQFLNSGNSTIVTPICEDGNRGHHAPLPKQRLWARAVALWVTFLVSGLMHELIFLRFTKSEEPSWEATTFFVLHGFATSAEVALRRILPLHLSRVPTWVSVLLTFSFNFATANMFFLPPVLKTGTFAKCVAEYHYWQNWVLETASIL